MAAQNASAASAAADAATAAVTTAMAAAVDAAPAAAAADARIQTASGFVATARRAVRASMPISWIRSG
eukprot:13648462-Heterocapsa_arctica.AAC.1